MIKIGLTGGIGSGKSTVSDALKELGASIINADLIGHEAYLPHKNVWQDMVDGFGKEILTERDEVDRRKLGEIVFGNPEALKKLNSIVHPWMYRRMEEIMKGLEIQKVDLAVLEAAILIEANWLPLVDKVWVTVTPEEEVIKRISARNNLTPDQVRARINSQMSSSERVKYANVVIENNGTLEEVKEKVRREWAKLGLVKKV